ncbi:MAG: hypothetical protein H6R13_1136 [Proteobacteria bacterium]|nr:hypothetical protein [Pseudomonadota bacterium]
MTSCFNQSALKALEATATTASAYLDACDHGARFVRLDPAYYKSCGAVLVGVFSLVDAKTSFPLLFEQSAAAREVAESIQIGRRIELSRLGFYPELTVLINRAAA